LDQHFQTNDQAMHRQIIEREVLSCLVAFLESKGVDTSELRETESTIINQGLIMTGGSISGGAVSIGPKATASNKAGQK
jgi:hypothetical protein